MKSTSDFPAKGNPLLLSFNCTSKNKSVTLGLDTVCLNTENRKTDKKHRKTNICLISLLKITKLLKKDDNELTKISRKILKTTKGNAYAKQNNIISTILNRTLIMRFLNYVAYNQF